jgi:predicted SnoaL-like aldol condensation-catalyzing enzyme
MTQLNKELIRRLIEQAVNTGNLNVADELLTPDYVYHEPSVGEKRGPKVSSN